MQTYGHFKKYNLFCTAEKYVWQNEKAISNKTDICDGKKKALQEKTTIYLNALNSQWMFFFNLCTWFYTTWMPTCLNKAQTVKDMEALHYVTY